MVGGVEEGSLRVELMLGVRGEQAGAGAGQIAFRLLLQQPEGRLVPLQTSGLVGLEFDVVNARAAGTEDRRETINRLALPRIIESPYVREDEPGQVARSDLLEHATSKLADQPMERRRPRMGTAATPDSRPCDCGKVAARLGAPVRGRLPSSRRREVRR
jgi:hypothetical protein